MGHNCTLIYQGQRFELAESLGEDAYLVTMELQQRIAETEYLRAVQIDDAGGQLPPGRIPNVSTGPGEDDHEPANLERDGLYRYFPFDPAVGDPFDNYIRVDLANGNTLFMWVGRDMQFAVEGPRS